MLLIHFSCYFGKQRRFLPPGAYRFLTSSVYVPLNTNFDQLMWWNNVIGLVKDPELNETLGRIEVDF